MAYFLLAIIYFLIWLFAESTLPWESYSHERNELQKLATRVLSLACSAAKCERNWSVLQFIHSKRSNSLEQLIIKALVLLKHNMQLVLRQNKRSVGNTYNPISFLCMDPMMTG